VQIKNNPGKLVYKTTGCFTKHNIPFNLQHEFETPDQVIEFLEASHDFTENGGVYSIKKDKIKQKKVAPPLPLITSTLQQQASNKFNMGSKETMKHAQTLYEKGYITYMRTDSKKYSGEFIESTTAHIVETYGGEYVNPLIDDLSLIVKTRTVENMDKIKAEVKKGKKVKVCKASTKKTPVDGKEKEADTPHEAVRPTDILLENIPERYPPRTKSLYRLIRTHALQSCMSSATFAVLTVRIPTVLTVDNEDDEVGEVRTYEYRASAEEMLFAGWMVLNTGRVEDRNYNYLQSLGEGSTVGCQGIRGVQQLKDAVRHYTEAALIQLLEKRGIGRPSTFASLIGKIQERGYAVKGSVSGRVIMCRNFELSDVGEIIEEEAETQFNAEKNKLVIQPLGILVIECVV
jgi:DNA topoisomerase-1